MNRHFRILIFAAAAALTSSESHAQYTLGLQTGLLQPVMKTTESGGSRESFGGNMGFAITVTATKQCTKHISAGLSLRYLARNFNYLRVSSYQENNWFEDYYKGRFVYLGATGDIGIGKKQLLHLSLTPAYGFLTSGDEQYYNGSYTSGHSSGTMLQTDNMHMSKTDFRLGTQLSLNIPCGKGFAVSPGITYNIGFSSLNDVRNLHPADLIFSLGISWTTKRK